MAPQTQAQCLDISLSAANHLLFLCLFLPLHWTHKTSVYCWLSIGPSLPPYQGQIHSLQISDDGLHTPLVIRNPEQELKNTTYPGKIQITIVLLKINQSA